MKASIPGEFCTLVILAKLLTFLTHLQLGAGELWEAALSNYFQEKYIVREN
ncbi:hypothetical protein M758_8G061700 [Ceratodon purpureus]|uniref:Uncharacterized protein n=1 Tax=Ceratodon purpureus TaxID=3225 RepID=A0A8T0GZ80_CERPU|nr:hypothetical protein KC19_8G065100 [Ceratodon purpureus]KAG0607876.1 hypothetical protein M758_8G061700 [Ceratodon purpureus]